MRPMDSLTRAERFEWALEHSGKTASEIAAAIGCSQPALSQWKSGSTKAYDAELLLRFARECNVRVDWLLWGEEPARPPALFETELERRALSALRAMEERAPYRAEAAVVMLEAAAGTPEP